jgi:hypothetical protein
MIGNATVFRFYITRQQPFLPLPPFPPSDSESESHTFLGFSTILFAILFIVLLGFLSSESKKKIKIKITTKKENKKRIRKNKPSSEPEEESFFLPKTKQKQKHKKNSIKK